MRLRRTIPRGDEDWSKSFQYEIVVTNYGNSMTPRSYSDIITNTGRVEHRRKMRVRSRIKRSPALAGISLAT